MWYERDFRQSLSSIHALEIKILKGPRQVGKTSLLERMGSHQIVYFDDAAVRSRAQENPRFFLDSLATNLILDEAQLVPELFPELKRRVDAERRADGRERIIDYWVTGSNQTLLRKEVRESLAGRASYFDLNTLSIHELGADWQLTDYLLRGGWPELYVSQELSPIRYLNDLVTTFIEKDIVSSAGIEKKAAFTKFLQLLAGRVGELFNASDIASVSQVDSTTIHSWKALMEDNGIIRALEPYWSNVNKRLTKTPKVYFEDVALAIRLQGWTELQPILNSPVLGHIVENIALSEIVRFFINRGEQPKLNFLRSKEKVEVDLLIHLPNQRVIAAEVKLKAKDFTLAQKKLLETLDLNIVDYWVLSPTLSPDFPGARVVTFNEIWTALNELIK